jgi:four helix bundle protein
MSKIERFEDLIDWQKARVLVREIYGAVSKRPFARDFALRDQITRAAISVPSNIAEGFERSRRTEFHQFLSIAKGSCGEVRTQIYLAYDIGYINDEQLRALLGSAEEVGRIIGGLRAKVAAKRSPLSTQHSALST